MREDGTTANDVAMVLTASRRKWFGVSAVCLVFVAAGLLVLRAGKSGAVGWITIAFFGVCLIVSVAQLVIPGQLVVSHEAIEVHHLGRRWSRDLARCGPFDVWRSPLGRQAWVVFDHSEDRAKPLARSSRGLSGHSSALPDTYGRTAVELVNILNEARAKALSSADSSAP